MKKIFVLVVSLITVSSLQSKELPWPGGTIENKTDKKIKAVVLFNSCADQSNCPRNRGFIFTVRPYSTEKITFVDTDALSDYKEIENNNNESLLVVKGIFSGGDKYFKKSDVIYNPKVRNYVITTQNYQFKITPQLIK